MIGFRDEQRPAVVDDGRLDHAEQTRAMLADKKDELMRPAEGDRPGDKPSAPAEIVGVIGLLEEIDPSLRLEWGPINSPELIALAESDDERATVERHQGLRRRLLEASRDARVLDQQLRDARDGDDGTVESLEDQRDLERLLVEARTHLDRLTRELNTSDREIAPIARRGSAWRENAIRTRSRQIEAAREAFDREVNRLKFRLVAVQRARDLCPVLGDLLGGRR